MKFEKRQRYAIRKFSVGAASVLIGQFYLGSVANAPVVHANEITQQAPEASSSESNTSSSESASTEAASLASTETSAESVSVDKSKLQLTYQTFINLMKEEVNLSDKTADSVAAYNQVRAYAEELQLKAEELLLNGDATAEAVEAMNKELVSITAKLSRAMRSLEVVAQPAPEVKTEASVEKSETKTSESSAKETKTSDSSTKETKKEVTSEKTPETKVATAKEDKTEKVVQNKPAESKQEEKSSEADAESAAHRELTEAVTKAEASVQEAEKELTTKEVEETTRKHLLGTVENAKLQIQAAKTSLQEPNQTDIELNRSLGQLRSSIEAVYTELKKVGVSSSANKEDQVATGRKRTKRSTETPVSPNKPYITIERQYGPDYNRNSKDYTVVKNGDILDIKYKTGTTRIAATDVELTPDAKALGLSYDPVAGYITGRVVLNAAFQAKTYEIGLMSKADNSIKTTADLNVRPHHGFVLTERFNEIVNKTGGTNDPYHFTLTQINGNRATNYQYDGPPFLKDDGTDILTYEATLPVTPFGYYISRGTVANATSVTKQYKMGIQVGALGDRDNYTKNPTITKIEAVNNPANIAFEYKKNSDESPLGTFEYSTNYNSPYYIEFTRLPKTAGKYSITFKTTDSLGLVRTFVVNITTVEKSQDGYLTNADIRFKPTTELQGEIEKTDPNNRYNKLKESIAQIPSSMDEQEIGKIELNKENASILPVRFPDGVEYDATTRIVKKKSGTRLAPGKYTFEAKAVDGHFGNNAPTRIMTFEVIDGVNPIAHQVWKENKEISALPVTLAHGSRIKEVKIINQGPEHADLYVDQATHTIKGSGVKRTTANQTVNVEVSYYNAEGGITKTNTTFTYEVQPGDPVTDVTVDVSNAEQTVKEGEQIKPMVITATPGADVRVSNLPAGLSYDANTQTITGIGVKEGVYTFPVTATKDGKTARKEAKLTVTAGKLVALDYNYEYTIGEPITPFTIAKAADTGFSMGYDYDLGTGGFLINGQPISFRIEDQVGDITFSGTPTKIYNYNVTYTLKRTLSTGEVQTATGQINLKVKGLPIEAPSAQTTVQVGKPLSLTLTPQVGTKVTIETSSLPNGVRYDENTNTFSGTPTQVGTFNIRTTARFTDPNKSDNPAAYGQVQINVTAKPLTITGQEKTVTAGDALPPVTIETSEGATIDGDVSRYLPRGVTFNSATKTFSGTPMEVGTFNIPLVAKYPEYSLHPSASATFTLHVKSRAVSVADESRSGEVLKPMTPLTLNVSNGAKVTFDESLLPPGVTYDSNTKTFSGNPTKVGTYVVPVTASYPGISGNDEARGTVTFTVTPQAPSIAISNNNQTVKLGEAIQSAVVTHNPNAALSIRLPYGSVEEEDINDYLATYGLSYDASTNTITGTPNKVGTLTFKYRAKNPADIGGGSADETFTLTVQDTAVQVDVNQARQLVRLGSRMKDVVLTPTAGATLTVDTTKLPSGVTYDQATKTISGTPGAVGSYEIPVTATLGESTVTRTVVIDVVDLKDGTSIHSGAADPTSTTGKDGDTYVNTTTGDTFIKNGDTWVKNGNVKGPQGAKGDKGEDGAAGAKGDKGEDGTSITITKTEPQANGDVKVTFSDGREIIVPKGAKGDKGEDGTSITITKTEPQANGDVKVTFSDGREIIVPKGAKGDKGEDGAAGAKGDKGEDGTSITITKTEPQANGDIKVTFSDGREIIVPKGAKGDKGEDGAAGAKGDKGEDGTSITITKTEPQANGDVKVTFSDGREIIVPKGAKGDKGEDGTSITITKTEPQANGDIKVTFSDGREIIVPKGAKGDKGEDGAAGAKGDKGEDGTSITITKTEPQANGDVKVTFSDGREIIVPKGAKGDKGEDGTSITITKTEPQANGDVKVTFSDGREIIVPKGAKGDKGEDGAAGAKGDKGEDGTSITITKTEPQANGDIKVTFSDGREIIVPKGAKGDKGEDGAAGAKGDKGEDGTSITITKTEPQANGDIKVTFSDGKEIIVPKGAKGDKGEDGTSITITKTEPQANGDIKVTFSDGREIIVPKGAKGDKGEDGTSITITKTEPQANGDVKVTFSDGREIIVPKGAKGDKGEDGTSITITKTEPQANGDVKVTFSDGREIIVPKGAKGDKGEDGTSITITKTEPQANGDVKVTFSDGREIIVPKGAKGDKGEDGTSITITKTEPQANGDVKVTFSDGREIIVPKGAKGDKGEDGTSITITKTEPQANGDIKVTFSDGREIIVPKGAKGDKGEDGAAGAKGDKGEDGTSITITKTEPQANGDIKVTFSDGKEIIVPKGAKGDKGEDGTSITITKTEPQANGDIKVTFSDGREIIVPKGAKGDKGEDGAAGAKGDKGEDGTSITITKTEPQANGDIKVTFSDGREIIVPKGAKGDKGEDGKSVTVTNTTTDPDGNTVISFSDGSQVTVKKGDKGDTGAQGPKGDKGDKGDTGTQGPKGDKGDKGDTGTQGPKGDKGDKGDTGAQGPKGDKGDKGDTGAQGPKGDKGDKGDTGTQGPKGDKGDKGDTGAQGPKGDKGDKGDTGAQGPKGDKGDKGDTGTQGPKGDKGDKGDTGAQGPKGDKGDKGDTGAQGPKGDKGDKGDTGTQGPKGDKGDKGDTGTQGPKGDKGDKGDTGTQGPKGDKGDKGDTGAQGPKGDTGATGQNGINGGGNNGGGNNGGGNNGGGNNGGGNNGGGNNGGGNNGGGNNGGGNNGGGNNGGGNSNLNPGPIPNPKPNKDGDGTQNLISKDVFTNRTANSSNFGKQLPNTGTEELSLLAPLALTAISFGGLLVFGKKRED